jgi:hypothetical protein
VDGGLAGLGIGDTTSDPSCPIHDFDVAVAAFAPQHVRRERGHILLTSRPDPDSVAKSPSSRSALMCSMPPACRTWMPSAPLCVLSHLGW